MIIKNNGLNDKYQKDYLFNKIFNLAKEDYIVNIMDWYYKNYDNLSLEEIKFIYDTMKITDFEFYNYLTKLFNQIGGNELSDILDLKFIMRNLELMYIARILVGDTLNSTTLQNNLEFLNETKEYFKKI